MKKLHTIIYHPFIIRLLHWEYWPFHLIYGPLYIYWLWLSARSRSFFFFNAANPTIENGGFIQESKHKIYELMPTGIYPVTIFLKKGTTPTQVGFLMVHAGLEYPVIAKPDVGAKGRLVRVINNADELAGYCTDVREDFLVQEMICWEQEAGIFYYRIPGERRGNISGIVAKEFLAVTGDGRSTLEELLRQNKRHLLQLPVLRMMYPLQRVLRANEKMILVPFGNHARGAKFTDASLEADERLVTAIDHVCQKIPGFYYGRLDIRFKSWEDLRHGKHFSIIEVNGAGSEPTHIYDPRHSILFAWREIIRHWNLLQRISRINHEHYKVPYLSYKEGMQMFRNDRIDGKLTTEE